MAEEQLKKLDPAALAPLIPAGVDVTAFTVSSPHTIARELHALQTRRDLISVYFDTTHIWFLSALQSVDETRRSFSFDISVDEALNCAFEGTNHAVIAAMPNGVTIQFELPSTVKRIVDIDGRPSFQAQFPSALINWQRRDFLRVPLPMAKRLLLTLRGRDGELIDAQLHDLSIGGMGLVITEGVKFELGDIFTACLLGLSNSGIVEVTMVVLSKRQIVKADLSLRIVVGTKFVNLSRSAESLLHRYIGQLQRERDRVDPK